VRVSIVDLLSYCEEVCDIYRRLLVNNYKDTSTEGETKAVGFRSVIKFQWVSLVLFNAKHK